MTKAQFKEFIKSYAPSHLSGKTWDMIFDAVDSNSNFKITREEMHQFLVPELGKEHEIHHSNMSRKIQKSVNNVATDKQAAQRIITMLTEHCKRFTLTNLDLSEKVKMSTLQE